MPEIMIWLWLFFAVFALTVLYFIFVTAKPRHILLGSIIALAIAAFIGTAYLIFSGKFQWIWASATGFLPWVGRFFFIRKLFRRWQKEAVSKFTCKHLRLTVSWQQNNVITDGILLQEIKIDDTHTLQAGTNLSAIDGSSLENLQRYFHQHDGEAFYLLAYYGSISGQIIAPYHLEETLSFSPTQDPMTITQAQEILGLSSPHYSENLVKKAHERSRHQFQPPKGNPYLLDMIDKARDTLLT